MAHGVRQSAKYMNRIGSLHEEDRKRRFDEYFTFLFVREPLERLVSGYHDKYKFIEKPESYRYFDTRIVRKYRPRDYKPSVKRYNGSLYLSLTPKFKT